MSGLIERAWAGFTYTFEHFTNNVRDSAGRVVRLGELVSRDVVHNLMPYEGIHHMESVTLLDGTKVPTWYLGLYTNDYTPQQTDTMAAFVGLVGEVTQYVGATRPALVFGAPAAGVISNQSNKIEIEATAAITVRGGFMSSSPTKGATTGVLLSAVRQPSPRALASGDVLRVTAGFNIISA